MRLTDISIRALKAPERGAQIYYDDILNGFGVRVSQAGTKSFVLTHGPRRRRETIGRVGILALGEARTEAKRRLAEYTLGKHRPIAKSWRAALDEYLVEAKKKCRDSTFKSYDRHLHKHFRFGNTRMEDVSPHDIQRDLDKLVDRPAERHHAFVCLRAFMRWAHRRHYVDRNPMERMQTPDGSTPRERILTAEELKQVWLASGDDTYGHIVKLLILTGQRVGEITKLQRGMIGDAAITLPSWLTKNGREHTFPLPKSAGELIAPMLRRLEPAMLLFPARGATDRPFNGFGKCKANLDKSSGVTDWTLHDLRRTFASGLASLGVALPVIEKLLNHVSGSFGGIVGVYQRYDFMPEMREAVAKWESHIERLLAVP